MSRNTLAALALLALAAPAHAADAPAASEPAPEYSLTANVTLASQYRYRGLMQTNNKPAIQGWTSWRRSNEARAYSIASRSHLSLARPWLTMLASVPIRTRS